MPRKSVLLTLLVLCTFATVVQAAVKDVIPAGTILQCTLDEPNFSAKTALVGDPVLCHLGALGSFGHWCFRGERCLAATFRTTKILVVSSARVGSRSSSTGLFCRARKCCHCLRR